MTTTFTYVIMTMTALVVGAAIGWFIAKSRFKKYQGFLEREVREKITPEQMAKNKEEDDKFWKMKKEVENGRKRKDDGNRPEESNSDIAGGDRSERRGNSDPEDNSGSIRREQIPSASVEQSGKIDKGTKFYQPKPL
jgi:hypothetical protein